MKAIKTDIFLILENWFEKRGGYWTLKGFKINRGQPSSGRSKKSIDIGIDKGNIISNLTVWETGECDFLQVDENDSNEKKYFKNVILTSEEQAFWELENYFFNFDSLKGSSVDPYLNPDSEE